MENFFLTTRSRYLTDNLEAERPSTLLIYTCNRGTPSLSEAISELIKHIKHLSCSWSQRSSSSAETVCIDMSMDSFYLSAPASSSRTNPDDNMCFYSFPNSPSWEITLKTAGDLETKPASPGAYEGGSDSDDLFEFEFETSRRFNIDDYDLEINTKSEDDGMEAQLEKQEKEEKPRSECRGSLPAMAFADELFCEGMVMPLKPPPRLQYSNSQPAGLGGTEDSSNPIIKNPFPGRSLWNDDFDPFMAAWKNVKGDNSGKCQGKKKNHRRAQSMMPLQSNELMETNHRNCKQLSPLLPNLSKQKEQSVSNPSMKSDVGGNRSLREVGKSSIRLDEPRGVLFARRARLVKMDPDWPRKASKVNRQEPKVEAGEDAKHSKEPSATVKKSKSVKNFLFKKSSSRKKTSDKLEQTEQVQEVPEKPKLMRKSSVKSMGLVQCNEENGMCQATEMTLAQCKPKLFLCLGGFGAKHVK